MEKILKLLVVIITVVLLLPVNMAKAQNQDSDDEKQQQETELMDDEFDDVLDSLTGPRTITMTGTGTIKARPDVATVGASVEYKANKASEALKLSSQAMDKIIAVIKSDIGIQSKDIKTTNLSLYPVYDRDKNNNQTNKITGYQVRNSIQITIRDLTRIGEVFDKLVENGAISVNGPDFTISNADEIADEAYKQAVASAKHKATLIATAAGVELGPVIAINEQNNYGYQPRLQMRAYSVSADSAGSNQTPVEVGLADLSRKVTIVWGIVDGDSR